MRPTVAGWWNDSTAVAVSSLVRYATARRCLIPSAMVVLPAVAYLAVLSSGRLTWAAAELFEASTASSFILTVALLTSVAGAWGGRDFDLELWPNVLTRRGRRITVMMGHLAALTGLVLLLCLLSLGLVAVVSVAVAGTITFSDLLTIVQLTVRLSLLMALASAAGVAIGMLFGSAARSAAVILVWFLFLDNVLSQLTLDVTPLAQTPAQILLELALDGLGLHLSIWLLALVGVPVLSAAAKFRRFEFA